MDWNTILVSFDTDTEHLRCSNSGTRRFGFEYPIAFVLF
jgi:hypothetical protein